MRNIVLLFIASVLSISLPGCLPEESEKWLFFPLTEFCGKVNDNYDGSYHIYPSCEECELANYMPPENRQCTTVGGGGGDGGTNPDDDNFNGMIWIDNGYTGPYTTIENVRVRVFRGYVNTPSSTAGKPLLADTYLNYEGQRYGSCSNGNHPSTSSPNTFLITGLEYGETYSTLTTYTLDGTDKWFGNAGWRIDNPNTCINNLGYHWIRPRF